MDKDVNPCGNFYDFACGKWLKMNTVPEDGFLYRTLNEINEDNLMTLKCKICRSS